MKNNQLPVINKEGEKLREEPITGDFIGIEAPVSLVAQSIRKFLNNQRKALANTKRRGAVAGSTIKIWKQKGTGRARHGDRQAPIFVGGGKAHGPTGKQNYKLKLSKKMSQKAVLAVLNNKIKEKQVFLMDNFEIGKTKEAGIFINKFKEKSSVKGRILLLFSSKDKIQKYFRNLSNVKIQNMENLNSYSMLQNQTLLITKNGLAAIAKKEEKND